MIYPTALSIGCGQSNGWAGEHKFGYHGAVGTSYTPVCAGGVFRTPQVSGATTLRVKAGGNANDTAAGSGARKIRLIGLNSSGIEITADLTTAGASASSPTTETFIRLYRMKIIESGTYATVSTGSQAAAITIENGAGTEDWATLLFDAPAYGQSLIGAYSIPVNKTAFVSALLVQT
ncbi:MAG: hypothetical protein GY771_10690, partial [bacterium]|nr:hypothetical protein [bacterium]